MKLEHETSMTQRNRKKFNEEEYLVSTLWISNKVHKVLFSIRAMVT